MKTIKLLFAILLCISCNNDDDKVEVSNNKPPEEIETEQPPINYSSIVKIESVRNDADGYTVSFKRFYENNRPVKDTFINKFGEGKSYLYNIKGLLKKRWHSHRVNLDSGHAMRTETFKYDEFGVLKRYTDSSYDVNHNTARKYIHNYYRINENFIVDSISTGGTITFHLNGKGLIDKKIIDGVVTDSIIYDSNSTPTKIVYLSRNLKYISYEYKYYDEEYRRLFNYGSYYMGEDINNYLIVRFNIVAAMNRKGARYIKESISSYNNYKVKYDYTFDELGFPKKLTFINSWNSTIQEEYFYEE